MAEAAVVNSAFIVTFGIIFWYAARLHLRFRRLTRQLNQTGTDPCHTGSSFGRPWQQ